MTLACICSLVKHAKISSLVRIFEIISLANETKAVNYRIQLNFGFEFFREKYDRVLV